MASVRESNFQRSLKKELVARFPGVIIAKLDASATQGIPDLLILLGEKWASLENKRSKDAAHRPNQDYYVNKMNNMSFSRFIYPENKEEVLDDLERFFKGV